MTARIDRPPHLIYRVTGFSFAIKGHGRHRPLGYVRGGKGLTRRIGRLAPYGSTDLLTR
jgi:hypothetical protein